MPPPLILDPRSIDCSKVVADQEVIRRFNPHRFHMEHLNACVYMDSAAHLCAGYKDVRHDEFWVSGHMPGYPILPGVIQCEAAAQLVSFYALYNGVMSGNLIGLSGIENAKFRRAVRPGERLLIVGKGVKVARRQTVFNLQGFVDDDLAFHCDIYGVPLPAREASTAESAAPQAVGT